MKNVKLKSKMMENKMQGKDEMNGISNIENGYASAQMYRFMRFNILS